jgi:hypothetical protein
MMQTRPADAFTPHLPPGSHNHVDVDASDAWQYGAVDRPPKTGDRYNLDYGPNPADRCIWVFDEVEDRWVHL